MPFPHNYGNAILSPRFYFPLRQIQNPSTKPISIQTIISSITTITQTINHTGVNCSKSFQT
ncbi:hypothetical protein Hanom_Chr11g01049641 [Helianthus anomalus]